MIEKMQNKLIFIILFICICIFAFMDYRYLDVEFLGATMGDEMPQFLQLQKMYEGIIELNIKKFFAFEFYNYGFLYYLLNLIATLPFQITKNYELAIYAPRLLNALFSVINLFMIYKISLKFLDFKKSIMMVLIFISMSGFWNFGYAFKPDVFQAFFILLTIYFLIKDRFKLEKHFIFAFISLGAGVGVAKFQALMFLPLIYSYILVCSYKNKIQCIKQILISTISIIAIWIITNPYLLHKKGALAWWNMFYGNMQSNATNHGQYNHVSIAEKIQMIDFYYFNTFVFFALIILCFGLFIHAFIKKQKTIFTPLAVGFLISLSYLLFLTNKAWGSYYFSTIISGVLIFLVLAKSKWGGVFLCLILIMQIGGNIMNNSYKNVFTKFNKFINYSISDEIVSNLEKISPKHKTYNILTDTPDFRYRELGLEPKNIYTTFGLLNKETFVFEEWSKKSHTFAFIPKDFIILNKNSPWFKEAKNNKNKNLIESIDTLKALQNSKFPYKKAIESKNFIIFQNTDSIHSLIGDSNEE